MYPDESQVVDTEATDGMEDTVTSLSANESPLVKKKHSNGHIHSEHHHLFIAISLRTKCNYHVALSNGDAGDTDSSQETFELFGSLKKKVSGI